MHQVKSAAIVIGATLLVVGVAGAQGKRGNASSGRLVFEQCAACHNFDNDEKKLGPSMKGLFQRAKLRKGSPVTDAAVRAVINNGGNGMPAYQDLLSEVEKDDVIAYLKTL